MNPSKDSILLRVKALQQEEVPLEEALDWGKYTPSEVLTVMVNGKPLEVESYPEGVAPYQGIVWGKVS